MKMVRLREVAALGSGGTPSRTNAENFGAGTPWVSITDLNDGLVKETKEMLTPAGLANSAAKIVPCGTVLVAMYGASIGKLGIAGQTLCTNQAIAAIQPDDKLLHRKYLYYYLLAQREHLRALGRGGAQPNISLGDLKNWTIPLPELSEQRRIAAILDRADGLCAKRRQVLSHLDAIAQSIFLDMFGKFSGKFLTVEEVAAPEKGSIRTGPFGSQLLHREFVDEGIAVLGLDNVVGNQFSWKERRYITPEKYQQLRRYTVHPGDVLVSIMGTCGRCVVVPPDVETAINTKHICAVTLDRNVTLPEFVRAAFLWHPRSRQHLTQRTKGSIMDGLNMGIVKEMPLPVPLLDEQRQFVHTLQQVDGLSHSCLQSSTELDNLFASLQSRAFSERL